ncbi:MAG: signal peptidase I [Candidatus Saganbacteria bacterium]|nr:signal peptidase I [Candidatus Saganbacteria bacterium]
MPKNKVFAFLKETFETIIWALALALIIRALFIQVFWIPSSSMEPTLNISDRIIVNKIAYGIPNPWFEAYKETKFLYIIPNPLYDRHWSAFDVKYFWDFGRQPKRFDIVVFKFPYDSPMGRKDLIKRVIGLPGEKLAVKKGIVYINGKALEEKHQMNFAISDFGPVTVPAGMYFMMGDNRPASADSRYWGFLPKPAFIRIWPLTAFGFVN